MFAILFTLQYTIYQTPYTLLAMLGGFLLSKIVIAIIDFKLPNDLSPKLTFLYILFSDRLRILVKIALSYSIFLTLVSLTCYGNILDYHANIFSIIINSIIIPLKLPWLLLSITPPFSTYCGMLIMPFLITFCYYFAKRRAKLRTCKAVVISSCVLTGVLLPIDSSIEIAFFSIKVEYLFLFGMVLLFMILAKNNKPSQIIYVTTIIIIVYYVQYNILPSINSSLPLEPVNKAHFRLGFSSPTIKVRSSSYLDNFRLMHNNALSSMQEILSIKLQGIDNNKALIKFAGFNDYDGVNLQNSNDFRQSALRNDQSDSISDKQRMADISIKNYQGRYLPTIIELQGETNSFENEVRAISNLITVESDNSNKFNLESNIYIDNDTNTLYTNQELDSLHYSVGINNNFYMKPTKINKVNSNNFDNLVSDMPYFNLWMQRQIDNYSKDLDATSKFAAIYADLMHYSHLSYSQVEHDNSANWMPHDKFEYVSTPSGYNTKLLDNQIFAPILKGSANCNRHDLGSPCALAFGDDLQFAVAGLLIAKSLNVDALVNIGALLPGDGKIKGENLAIWLSIANSNRIFITKPRTDNSLPPLSTYNSYLLYPSTIINNPSIHNIQAPHNDNQVLGSNENAGKSGELLDFDMWIILKILILIIMAVLILTLPITINIIKHRIRKYHIKRLDFIDSINMCYQFFISDLASLTRFNPGNNFPRNLMIRKYFKLLVFQNSELRQNVENFTDIVDKLCFTRNYNFSRSQCNGILANIYFEQDEIIRQIYKAYCNRTDNIVKKLSIICRYNLNILVVFIELYSLLHKIILESVINIKNSLNFIYARNNATRSTAKL